jgi:hypothetical protein
MVKGTPIILTNCLTGEEIELPSISAARHYCNLSTNIIHYRFNTYSPCIINGFKLQKKG